MLKNMNTECTKGIDGNPKGCLGKISWSNQWNKMIIEYWFFTSQVWGNRRKERTL